MAFPRILILILSGMGFSLVPASAQAQASIRHTLDLTDPAGHLMHVESVFAAAGEELELFMAVWTPGSYLVREYSRHVEGLEAETLDGAPLAVEKTRKNRWRIETGGAEEVRVRYAVYGREMSVRTNWIEADFAVLVGAATFLCPVGRKDEAHELRLLLPSAWAESVTALAPVEGRAHTYTAADFDMLVDCPIVCGNPAIYEFEVSGRPHVFCNLGEGGIWDGPRSAADVEKIVRAHHDFWGTVPYDRYVFLNVICESGGGLEHSASTLMMTSRWKSRSKGDYQGWLGLVSHEFFHTWNIKRLRPIALGPFDYEGEVYTHDLWIVEGITSYYDDLLLCRAGLMSERDYLARMSGNIQGVQTTPGRLVHPLGMTSFDAWIKYYRKDENSKNTTVSYYTKGAVVGWMLDMEIRRLTAGEKSLDDVMRVAYERYSGERGYTSQQFRDLCSEATGVDLSEWFQRAVDSTEELDYVPALDWLGMRLQVTGGREAGPGWLGLSIDSDDGKLIVTRVLRDSPGYTAGINVDDEILAIDNYRVTNWSNRLAHYPPGTEATILLSRREKLIRLPITFGREEASTWRLQTRSDATEEQRAARRAWLTGEVEGF